MDIASDRSTPPSASAPLHAAANHAMPAWHPLPQPARRPDARVARAIVTRHLIEPGPLNAFLRSEMAAVESYLQALARLSGDPCCDDLQRCHLSHASRCDLLRFRIISVGGTPVARSGPWSTMRTLLADGGRALHPASAIAALEQGEQWAWTDYHTDIDELDADSRRLIQMVLIPEQQRTQDIIRCLRIRHAEGRGGDASARARA